MKSEVIREAQLDRRGRGRGRRRSGVAPARILLVGLVGIRILVCDRPDFPSVDAALGRRRTEPGGHDRTRLRAARLLVGSSLYVVLPLDGYDDPDDKAGHVFTDAHRRDDQAWELAASGSAIWSAFDRSYYTDQYGGLLAASALAYRVLSPDSHRPLLITTPGSAVLRARSAVLLQGVVPSVGSWIWP